MIPEYCAQMNGAIELSLAGGSSPYQYSLDNTNFQMDSIFRNLSSGFYTFYFRDAMDCGSELDIEIPSIDGPQVEVNDLQHTTCGLNNGSIQISINTGTPPFLYSIDNGNVQESNIFANLTSGNHTLQVIDANQCETYLNVDIDPSSTILIDSIFLEEPNCDANDGLISLSISGNNGAVQTIINGEVTLTNLIFSGLSQGNYNIELSDQSNCQIDTTIILQQSECEIFIPNIFSPNGDNINDQFKIFSRNENVIINRMIIYDRWGGQVYAIEDVDLNESWSGNSYSGKPFPSGVYVYFIELFDGAQMKIFKGDVTLIR